MTLGIIIAAKYLFLLSPILVLYALWGVPREERRRFFIISALSFPLAYILGKLAGYAYFNPQPFVVEGFIPLVSHVADNAFPSDHTLLAATCAAVVFVFNTRIGVLAWGVAIGVGIGRVLAGVHHPIDVIASIVISILVVSLVVSYVEKPLRSYIERFTVT